MQRPKGKVWFTVFLLLMWVSSCKPALTEQEATMIMVKVNRGDVEALQFLIDKGKKGEKHAQLALGMMYLTNFMQGQHGTAGDVQQNSGDSFPNNEKEAVKWLQLAAEQGLSKAQMNLGLVYLQWNAAVAPGLVQPGTVKDIPAGMGWLRRAADAGFSDAQFYLGATFEHAIGGRGDMVEATKWYRVAAEQGHANAQNQLASMYEDGRGVAKDLTAAESWYRKAADHGNSSAQDALKNRFSKQ